MTARSEIILIGPLRAGKSTVARLLAQRLGVPVISLDRERWRYYEEAGYNTDHASKLSAESGFSALYEYRKPFEAAAVARLLGDYTDVVFDFGASHSVYEDEELLKAVSTAMEPFGNVVLLMPSVDPAETIRVLNARTGGMVREGFDFVAHFVTHPSNRSLAKTVIVTGGLTPEETCEEILTGLPRPIGSAMKRGPLNVVRKREELHRTTYAEHGILQRERLPCPPDYLEMLAGEHRRRRDETAKRLAPSLDTPLPEESRRFVNTCFGDADALTGGVLENARALSSEARGHGRALYARRLTRGETLRDLLACDPFDTILPSDDTAVLELLLHLDRTTLNVREGQRDALRLRFLHRPQRTRYLFLHELCVSHFMHAFQGPLTAEINEELGAAAIAALARHLGRDPADVLALHCADNATVDAALPENIRDLLLVSAHLYFYMELSMRFRWGFERSRVVADLLRYFTLPSLARMDAKPRLEMAQHAGARIDDAFCTRLYGHNSAAGGREPDADDVREALLFCADAVWQERLRPLPRAIPAMPGR